MKKLLKIMSLSLALALGAAALAACSVARQQQTAGEYVDDAAITTRIKAEFAKDKTVAATSIGVETLNGEVQLSGFAKSDAEKSRAGEIARSTKGVRNVKNAVEVQR